MKYPSPHLIERMLPLSGEPIRLLLMVIFLD